MSSPKEKKKRYGPYSSGEIASVRKKPKDKDHEKYEDKYAEKWLDDEARTLARDSPHDETSSEKKALDRGESWLQKENKNLDKYDEEKKDWKEKIDRLSGKKPKKFDKKKYEKEKEQRAQDGWEVVG
jgi:hypothetical protein